MKLMTANSDHWFGGSFPRQACNIKDLVLYLFSHLFSLGASFRSWFPSCQSFVLTLRSTHLDNPPPKSNPFCLIRTFAFCDEPRLYIHPHLLGPVELLSDDNLSVDDSFSVFFIDILCSGQITPDAALDQRKPSLALHWGEIIFFRRVLTNFYVEQQVESK